LNQKVKKLSFCPIIFECGALAQTRDVHMKNSTEYSGRIVYEYTLHVVAVFNLKYRCKTLLMLLQTAADVISHAALVAPSLLCKGCFSLRHKYYGVANAAAASLELLSLLL
jgi:hypothetical protein